MGVSIKLSFEGIGGCSDGRPSSSGVIWGNVQVNIGGQFVIFVIEGGIVCIHKIGEAFQLLQNIYFVRRAACACSAEVINGKNAGRKGGNFVVVL